MHTLKNKKKMKEEEEEEINFSFTLKQDRANTSIVLESNIGDGLCDT